MKEKKTDKVLLEQYHDPENPGNYGGVSRFAKNQGISVKKAKAILENDLGYTLHKPTRRKFPTLPVKVFTIVEQWTVDLIEVINISKQNQGYKYLLTVVEVFSKYAWVEPIKTKTGQAVTDAFEKILKQGRKPIQLQTDSEKEFYNKTFAQLLKRCNIHHFSTSGDTKASMVERFNRTLKQRMYRYFTTNNTLKFVPVLQSLVKGYNRTYHRSIKIAPYQPTEAKSSEVHANLYKNKKVKKTSLKVGDRVRLNKKFTLFKKGYLPGWTEEVFVIRESISGPVPTYNLEEWDGTPLKGTFYEQDVQRVNVTDDNIFRIEKIVKRKGNKLLVQWKGWPQKYNSWIEKGQIAKL